MRADYSARAGWCVWERGEGNSGSIAQLAKRENEVLERLVGGSLAVATQLAGTICVCKSQLKGLELVEVRA